MATLPRLLLIALLATPVAAYGQSGGGGGGGRRWRRIFRGRRKCWDVRRGRSEWSYCRKSQRGRYPERWIHGSRFAGGQWRS